MKMIVYYSHTGKTEQLANKLAAILDAKTLRILDVKPRRGILGFIRSGYESATSKVPAITLEAPLETAEIAACDSVILLGPIWAGGLCSPLRAFLTQYGQSIGKYAVVMTCGDESRPQEKAWSAISALCGKPAATSCTVSSSPADYALRAAELADDLVKHLK